MSFFRYIPDGPVIDPTVSVGDNGYDAPTNGKSHVRGCETTTKEIPQTRSSIATADPPGNSRSKRKNPSSSTTLTSKKFRDLAAREAAKTEGSPIKRAFRYEV